MRLTSRSSGLSRGRRRTTPCNNRQSCRCASSRLCSLIKADAFGGRFSTSDWIWTKSLNCRIAFRKMNLIACSNSLRLSSFNFQHHSCLFSAIFTALTNAVMRIGSYGLSKAARARRMRSCYIQRPTSRTNNGKGARSSAGVERSTCFWSTSGCMAYRAQSSGPCCRN